MRRTVRRERFFRRVCYARHARSHNRTGFRGYLPQVSGAASAVV